ncbi:MAG: S-methyl-5'-thioadenosine phosphorylase [Candidatus Wallacebacter cryptica]|jgi:5'-methylthioadenosine phosphorylase
MRLAVIGGTGVYDPMLLDTPRSIDVKTPYGPVPVTVGVYQNSEIAFVARHGSGHSVLPHQINYRGIIWALKSLGVEYIIGTNAVGSANPAMRPGHFVVIDQFIDFTKQRPFTFFDGENTPVVHVDITEPYCQTLRQIIVELGRSMKLAIHERGCYVCFEGPRYETSAEVRMAGMLGGDVLGMTNVPEVVLAREAGICYATICVVTNMGAGMAGAALSHDEVSAIMSENMNHVRRLALDSLAAVAGETKCTCSGDNVSLPGMQDS